MVDLNYTCHIELSSNKLSDNNLASGLVENRDVSKAITIEEIVIFMITIITGPFNKMRTRRLRTKFAWFFKCCRQKDYHIKEIIIFQGRNKMDQNPPIAIPGHDFFSPSPLKYSRYS